MIVISVEPNCLEKYMAFMINNNWVFIESMQFMNTSLDTLVKTLSDSDFKYLSQDLSGDFLDIEKKKGVYPFDDMDT